MEIKKSIKVRIYPTEHQEALLVSMFGCKRFIWNQMLAERERVYLELKNNKKALLDCVPDHQFRRYRWNGGNQRFRRPGKTGYLGGSDR